VRHETHGVKSKLSIELRLKQQGIHSGPKCSPVPFNFGTSNTESPAEPELATAASMSPEIAGEFISFVLELSILFIRSTELKIFFIAT